MNYNPKKHKFKTIYDLNVCELKFYNRKLKLNSENKRIEFIKVQELENEKIKYKSKLSATVNFRNYKIYKYNTKYMSNIEKHKVNLLRELRNIDRDNRHKKLFSKVN